MIPIVIDAVASYVILGIVGAIFILMLSAIIAKKDDDPIFHGQNGRCPMIDAETIRTLFGSAKKDEDEEEQNDDN